MTWNMTATIDGAQVEADLDAAVEAYFKVIAENGVELGGAERLQVESLTACVVHAITSGALGSNLAGHTFTVVLAGHANNDHVTREGDEVAETLSWSVTRVPLQSLTPSPDSS